MHVCFDEPHVPGEPEHMERSLVIFLYCNGEHIRQQHALSPCAAAHAVNAIAQ